MNHRKRELIALVTRCVSAILSFVVIRKIATVSLRPIRRDAISTRQASVMRSANRPRHELFRLYAVWLSLSGSIGESSEKEAADRSGDVLAPSLLPYVSRRIAINILVATTSIRPDAPGFRLAPKQQTMTRT